MNLGQHDIISDAQCACNTSQGNSLSTPNSGSFSSPGVSPACVCVCVCVVMGDCGWASQQDEGRVEGVVVVVLLVGCLGLEGDGFGTSGHVVGCEMTTCESGQVCGLKTLVTNVDTFFPSFRR